jgi:excisionase family DNA binding protein
MRSDFTTGQIATLCNVAPRTVAKWFDSGALEGWRIPGSGDRRVTRESLMRFLRRHKIPAPAGLQGGGAGLSISVLAVGFPSAAFSDALGALLGESWVARVDSATSAFEAGAMAAELRPDAVIVDVAIGRIEAGIVAAGVRELGVPVVVAVGAEGPLERFDEAVSRTASAEDLARLVVRQVVAKR